MYVTGALITNLEKKTFTVPSGTTLWTDEGQFSPEQFGEGTELLMVQIIPPKHGRGSVFLIPCHDAISACMAAKEIVSTFSPKAYCEQPCSFFKTRWKFWIIQVSHLTLIQLNMHVPC